MTCWPVKKHVFFKWAYINIISYDSLASTLKRVPQKWITLFLFCKLMMIWDRGWRFDPWQRWPPTPNPHYRWVYLRLWRPLLQRVGVCPGPELPPNLSTNHLLGWSYLPPLMVGPHHLGDRNKPHSWIMQLCGGPFPLFVTAKEKTERGYFLHQPKCYILLGSLVTSVLQVGHTIEQKKGCGLTFLFPIFPSIPPSRIPISKILIPCYSQWK